LVIKSKTAFRENGLFIMPSIIEGAGSINIHALIAAPENTKALFKVVYELFDATGRIVKDESYHTMMMHNLQGSETKFLFTYLVKNPTKWSTHNPYLYTLKAKLLVDGKQTDEVITKIGFRQIHFDAQKGFFLNDQPLKIKGVCMHHDLGALGAAFNATAAKRQLQILKDMGCNAIRFSHNPPASAMLDLCDEMGFLVMDEAFDMWRKKKNKNNFDYHLYFDEWHERDLQAMVLRDRNHPAVFMWSIGNEIREQFDSTGTTITKRLVEIVKELDPTRPVTSALTETVPEKNFITKANALDVLGFNYKYYDYPELPKRFPGQKFIATETASALETRGVYEFPSDSLKEWPPDYKAQDTFAGNTDFTASAYDNTFAYWGGSHEKTWLEVKKYPHMAGIFVWSGFDFLGEPMPYPHFPARSSYYGIVDLAGFPKDVYYMYQSEWTTKPVLHIFPHWNWVVGDTVDVWAYYNNADEVELFLNGKSLGVKSKTDSTLHVMWRVPYAKGTIRVVSRSHGKTVLEEQVKTAGKPAGIMLSVDKSTNKADGKDLSFVTATIVDKNGLPVPHTDMLLSFHVSGTAVIAGTDNGYQADTTTLQSHSRKTWKGKALVIIKSSLKKGNSTLTVSSPGMPPATILLKTQD
jgi:beta-galactosidase